MSVGRVGIWTGVLDGQPMSRAKELAAEIESLGYAALWLPEAVGRDVLVNAALQLEATTSITIATGIANIWARDAMAMSAGHKTLTEAFPGRFLLGLGVSHHNLVERFRGHEYKKPLAHMRAYLDAMDSALYMAVPPTEAPNRVIGALGPRALELAAAKAAGAHPYFVPVEHTAMARQTMGEGPLLMPEQAAVLETDAARAREIARAHMAIYLGTVNYPNNLRRLGFTEDDLAGGGSDRLADAIVAWGDLGAIRTRVKAHFDAGADHVCVQVLGDDPHAVPMERWRELAPALLDL